MMEYKKKLMKTKNKKKRYYYLRINENGNKKIISKNNFLEEEEKKKKKFIFLVNIYKNINGFNITQKEKDLILHKNGSPIYGEITYPSMKKIIKKLNLKQDDVFYDLGSGIGKFVIYMYLFTKIKKSVGIELSETRYKTSIKMLQKIKENRLIEFNRELNFIYGDIVEEDISDATIIYMCSTCYSDKLLQKLIQRFIKLSSRLRIITLKKLPDNLQLIYMDTWKISTTWANETDIYYYELNNNIV